MQRREVHLRLVSRCACPGMLLPSLTSASVQAVVSLRDNAVLQAQLTSRPIDLLRLANNGTGASSERSRGRWIVLIILPRRELLYECVRGAGLTCRCVLTSTAAAGFDCRFDGVEASRSLPLLPPVDPVFCKPGNLTCRPAIGAKRPL